MSSFNFAPVRRPFPRWMGPFSPARGTRSGFRFHNGQLGTWVADEAEKAFWAVADGSGARSIATLVRAEWGGGRVLLLPNGLVVKPLPGDEEVGHRALIGEFVGALKLKPPSKTTFDLSNPGSLRPGGRWPGPTTTGLECSIQSDGSLICSWYHPTDWGREEVTHALRGPDRSLVAGFRSARPGANGGRVRITANGHVITNREEANGTWAAVYVGYVDPGSWGNWDQWIE